MKGLLRDSTVSWRLWTELESRPKASTGSTLYCCCVWPCKCCISSFKRGFSVNSFNSFMGKSPLQCACASPYMDPRQNKEMVVFCSESRCQPKLYKQGWLHSNGHCKWVGKQGFQRIGRAPVRGWLQSWKDGPVGEDYLTLGNQN